MSAKQYEFRCWVMINLMAAFFAVQGLSAGLSSMFRYYGW